MKIIISPSKLQKVRRVPNFDSTPHGATEYTEVLVDSLRKFESMNNRRAEDRTGKVMGYSAPEKAVAPGEGHAIATYNGIVFHEIDWPNYDGVQLEYLERHLRIMSAFYGVLNPSTCIKPYRLDMTARLGALNLYTHWQCYVDRVFCQEDIIVNLASKEYSRMLMRNKYVGEVIDIDFKEEQSDGQLKIVTVHAKQARGLMTHYMVNHLIEEVELLKHFGEAGYQFEPKLSHESLFTFVRPYGWNLNYENFEL